MYPRHIWDEIISSKVIRYEVPNSHDEIIQNLTLNKYYYMRSGSGSLYFEMDNKPDIQGLKVK